MKGSRVYRRLLLCVLGALLLTPAYPTAAQETTCNGKAATTTGSQGTDGDDVMIGTEGDDVIWAGGGNDTICGLGGDDDLSGFLGDDHIDGGAGVDHLYGCDPSHGRSDAIVCHFYGSDAETDVDTMMGGEGNDHLFGQLSDDYLDGGTEYDVIDGGEATDSCAGERYTRCETMNPTEPPPACSDGIDNDSDGYTDAAADPECSRDRDPTEDIADDPVCYNGNDDDDDGWRDYPEDLGCTSFESTDEVWCHGFCLPSSVTLRYRSKSEVFAGAVVDRSQCVADRRVVVQRRTDGDWLVIGRDRTNEKGHWKVRERDARGRYRAVARRSTYETTGGDEPVCKRLGSPSIRFR